MDACLLITAGEIAQEATLADSRRLPRLSDAFYNNGAVTGSVDTGVVVDEQVPVCSGS